MAIKWKPDTHYAMQHGYAGKMLLFTIMEPGDQDDGYTVSTKLPLPPAHPSYDSEAGAQQACEIALSRFSAHLAKHATEGL